MDGASGLWLRGGIEKAITWAAVGNPASPCALSARVFTTGLAPRQKVHGRGHLNRGAAPQDAPLPSLTCKASLRATPGMFRAADFSSPSFRCIPKHPVITATSSTSLRAACTRVRVTERTRCSIGPHRYQFNNVRWSWTKPLESQNAVSELHEGRKNLQQAAL